jgi:hypothetical protein
MGNFRLTFRYSASLGLHIGLRRSRIINGNHLADKAIVGDESGCAVGGRAEFALGPAMLFVHG